MRVLAASFVLLCASTATAQGREALAQRRFEDGLAAREAGDHEGALEAFRASNELFESPNSRLMVARSLRDLGRRAEAWGEYRLAAARARERAARDPRYAATAEAASREADSLLPAIARLRVRLDGPDDATIEVQGRAFPSAALGEDVAVDPGELTVRASAPGHLDAELALTLAAGEEREVALALEAAPAAAPIEGEQDDFPFEPLGWTSVGLAAVGAALFAAFYALAQERFDAATVACGTPPTACPPSIAATIDEGRAFEAATNASWIGGLGFAAIGVTLLLVAFL